MNKVKNKIIVLSGKGGVGKSTVSVNIAVSLALAGYKTGLLDIDIHGPSVPVFFGIENEKLYSENEKIIPYKYSDNLKIISIGLLLDTIDTPAIWRGPMKYNVIKQFLEDSEWNELDYLIIDSPPGTGDEPLSVMQMIKDLKGAVIVTTPQKLAIADVRRSVNFCRKLDVPIIGVIENMSGFICPECRKKIDIFKSSGGEKMAEDMGIRFIGKIPIDPDIVESADSGKPYIEKYDTTSAADAVKKIVNCVLETEQNDTLHSA